MEVDRGLHYISRINDEKVYDELDLKIAKFILIDVIISGH